MRSQAIGTCVGLLALFIAGCGPEAPTRPWSASDHAHSAPRANQVNPDRSPRTQAQSPEVARARAIAALYRVSCASCHGAQGAGDGPEAPSAMPDFRSAEWQQSRSNEEIAQVIRIGRPPMPAFGDQIQGESLQGLVAYVRALGGAPPQ
ncbi:MAG: cytochrome c [Polyangiales bacterium]